jgi:hypothetical protein
VFDHTILVLRAPNVVLSLAHTMCGFAWAVAQVGEVTEALQKQLK